jgi:hypothetical protein
MWFDLWGVRNFAATRKIPFYLGLFGMLFVLFLVAASSLPDETNTSINLRVFYAENRRRFWFLVVLFQIGYVAAGIYFTSGVTKLPTLVGVLLNIQMIAPLALSLTLLATKSRGIPFLGIGVLFVVMLIHYGRATIN